jgi:hypothetical protein
MRKIFHTCGSSSFFSLDSLQSGRWDEKMSFYGNDSSRGAFGPMRRDADDDSRRLAAIQEERRVDLARVVDGSPNVSIRSVGQEARAGGSGLGRTARVTIWLDLLLQ